MVAGLSFGSALENIKSFKSWMFFCVQETIGGWKQTPVFEGSFDECQDFLETNCDYSRSSFAIVNKDVLKVDYL